MKRTGGLGLCALLLTLGACERQSEPEAPVPPPAAPVEEVGDPQLAPATVGVWLHGVAILEATQGEAQEMATAIDSLLTAPSPEALAAARDTWRRSHNAYLEFELFAAISDSHPALFSGLADFDFAIDAWPIQPGYLDYFNVYTHSGIVNDAAMPLTAEALRDQHGFTDASDVSIGFHALEYLLWGEQGERPATDYEEASVEQSLETSGVRPVDLPNNRRRALLSLLANLLIDDLAQLQQAVENPGGLLRQSYMALSPTTRLTLLAEAGQSLLDQQQNLLQAQIESSAGDAQTTVDPELIHSPYAGDGAAQLAHALNTVEEVLLGVELGVGPWLFEDEDGLQSAREQAAALRADLLAREGAWPPAPEEAQALLESLEEIAGALSGVSAEPAPEVAPTEE